VAPSRLSYRLDSSVCIKAMFPENLMAGWFLAGECRVRCGQEPADRSGKGAGEGCCGSFHRIGASR
jgi:hypothetical protein